MPQDQETESQESEDQSSNDAPDFLSKVWHWVYQRRTVQIALAYLAAGFAILEFLDIALRGSESADLILSLARLFYLLGFLLIVFAAPLVLTGTHYFRTGLVAGIVGISLITGILVRSQFEPISPAVPVTKPGITTVSQSPSLPGDANTPSIENSPDTVTATDVEEPQEQTTLPVDTTDAATDDNSTVDPVEQRGTSNPTVANPITPTTPPVSTNNSQSSVNQPIAPVPSSFDRLLLIYGESDHVVLDTSTRGQSLFANSNAPIGLRFYSVSGGRRYLNVEPVASRRAERLEFPSIRSTKSTVVQVETECGQLEYHVEATRVSDLEVEITGSIVLERSRANVERAEALGQCRLP